MAERSGSSCCSAISTISAPESADPGSARARGSAAEAEFPHQFFSAGLRVAGSGAPGDGAPPGRAAATSPYPPQYRLPAEPASTCRPQYFLGPMTTSRRTSVRPSRSSTVRCPSGPIQTKAVDKVRRPSASAGESGRRAGAGFSAADTGCGIAPRAAWARSSAPCPVAPGAADPAPSLFVSRDSKAAVPGTGLRRRIAASLGGGLQATSAAMPGSKRQGITASASLNTAFATRTARSSHRAGGVCAGPDRRDAEAAITTQACAGDRSDLQPTAGTHPIHFVNFHWGYQ
jgi:hypothetical protein